MRPSRGENARRSRLSLQSTNRLTTLRGGMTPSPIFPIRRSPLLPFTFVLLAAGIGIAGWMMTAAKEHPRLEYLHMDEALAAKEKETDTLHRAMEEFPGVLVEALKKKPMEDWELIEKPMSLWPSPLTASFGPLVERRNTTDLGLRGLPGRGMLEQHVFETLAKNLGTDATLLREKFFAFAACQDTTALREELGFPPSPLDATNLESFAGDLALLNARESAISQPPRRHDATKSYEAAAWLLERAAVRSQSHSHRYRAVVETLDHFQTAASHMRKAAALTDWRLDPAEWIRVQCGFARCLARLGIKREAEEILREVERDQTRRAVPDALGKIFRKELAAMIADENTFVQAEARYREYGNLHIMGMSGSGPEDIERLLPSLRLWSLEAQSIISQGRYAQAEHRFRVVQGYFDLEDGLQYPERQTNRMDLADVLEAQGKHGEAETNYRDVLEIRTRTLGAEHDDTLRTARELARCLDAQGKQAVALDFARLAANGWEKTLGAEHPRTLLARELVKDIERR